MPKDSNTMNHDLGADLAAYPWAREICDQIAEVLANKAKIDNIRILFDDDDEETDENKKIYILGVCGRERGEAYDDVELISLEGRVSAIEKRSKYMMLARLALSILRNLDLSNQKNLEYCIDFLTKIISYDAHRSM